MFVELVESRRKRERSLKGAVASAALHTALILLAIVATGSARTERGSPEIIPDIVYIPQASPRQVSAPITHSPAKRAASSAVIPSAAPIVAPVAVATGIPDVVPSSVPAAEAATQAVEGVGGDGGTVATGSGSGPLRDFEVDKAVRALSSNRGPVYPEMQRSRGIEGEVIARYIVNESGRVEMNTFEVISASSQAFVSAVRYALERARFIPAEASGRTVAQLVEQRFEFRLDR